METANGRSRQRWDLRIPVWLGLCLFLAVAIFLLWEEHGVHIYGALPYALVLFCLLTHRFMHRGHGGEASGGVS